MARKKLTTRFLETINVDARTDFWDDVVKGLVFRVSSTGAKSWSVVYLRDSDRKKRRVTIGPFPAVSLEKARKRGLIALTMVADGEDPAGDSAELKRSMTVGDLAEKYLEKYAKKKKRSWKEDERVLLVEVLPIIGSMKVGKVTKRDIIKIVDAKADAGRERQADLILAIVRKMFNWAVEKAHLEVSPVLGMKSQKKQNHRSRFLKSDEVKILWDALETANISSAMANIIRLLILTGQRSGEVCGIRKNEIDLANAAWTIPESRSKNKQEHLVPLVGASLEIIQSAMERTADNADAPLFATISKPIQSNSVSQAARKNLQHFEEPWTPHDLRRTVASGMAEIGILPHVIEATFNHISGFKSGVAGIYNRHDYEPEIREALVRWDAHVNSVIVGRALSNSERLLQIVGGQDV